MMAKPKPKTVKLCYRWFIVTPSGTVLGWNCGWKRRDALDVFEIEFPKQWDHYKAQGYTCRRLRISEPQQAGG